MKRQFFAAMLAVLCTTACASPALHVIGVHEGQFDHVTFAAKCVDKPEVTRSDQMSRPLQGSKVLSAECTAIHQKREVSVSITDDSKPIVLALNAYNKTLWKIVLKNGVKLQKVILAGYHSQQITGIPPEVPVEVYSYEPSPCKQCWQSSEYFYSWEKPPVQLRKITGLEVTSFQGRSTGSEFFIFSGMKKFE